MDPRQPRHSSEISFHLVSFLADSSGPTKALRIYNVFLANWVILNVLKFYTQISHYSSAPCQYDTHMQVFKPHFIFKIIARLQFYLWFNSYFVYA